MDLLNKNRLTKLLFFKKKDFIKMKEQIMQIIFRNKIFQIKGNKLRKHIIKTIHMKRIIHMKKTIHMRKTIHTTKAIPMTKAIHTIRATRLANIINMDNKYT
jgi:hypothetical protein